MPVPSSINDLSTTPGSNSPAGSESPATFDDYMRTFAAFMAQLRDGKIGTTGDQTIAGVKTFSSTIVGSVSGTAGVLSATLAVAKGGTGATDGGNLAQPGDIKFTARSTAPTGWLKADGTAVSRTTYAALFTAIGTTFGAGNGTTTFNLPDMRGEFPRGWDDGRGIDSGRVFGSTQTDAMQGHFHSGSFHQTGGTTAWTGPNSPGLTLNSTTPAAPGSPATDGVNGTPRTAAETRPRNVALLAVIKF